MIDILNLTFPELERFIVEDLGQPKFRAAQVWQWIWQKHATSFDAMTDVSKQLRAKLAEVAEIVLPEIVTVQTSSDGTEKLLLRLRDGALVETVILPSTGQDGSVRIAQCVSSQIGCAMGCTFCSTGTMGFIRKLPTELIESFKSTLDEVREADLLVHVVDISHPQFEEQIAVVKQTLQEIGAGDKPVYLVFNKVDAYTYIEKEEDDLTPATRENLSLEELKKSWIARANTPCIFLSALAKTNLEKFRSDLYGMVREIHAGRYPFNNFLY